MKWLLCSLLILGLCGSQFVYKSEPAAPCVVVSYKKPIKVRLLVLKHCKEKMADDDANLAINAVKAAAAKGLDIQVIGNHHIDKDGKSTQVCYYDDSYDLPKLQEFVSSQMKDKAAAGDTLVIFTIGHGGEQGSLQSIGQRADMMGALVGAAEQNNQKVLWWQLSCYASAKLPDVKSLTPQQQKLFCIVASSDAHTQSPSGTEGHIMEKVFVALAERSNAIDPNGDGVVTAAELSAFLVGSKRGNLVYAPKSDFPVFGQRRIILPIIDRNNPQGQYDLETYVPYPND